MTSEGPGERAHNHFSHILVPRLAFSDPEALHRDLADGSEELARLWCAMAGETPPAPPLLVTRGCESPEIFLIEMPPVEADCFACAIAVVFEGEADARDRHRVRYFTLENGPSLETGSSRHYLCEWEPDRGHANWGMLPGPDSGEFLRRIRSITSCA